jgi:hypothetical protein
MAGRVFLVGRELARREEARAGIFFEENRRTGIVLADRTRPYGPREQKRGQRCDH